VLRENTQLDFCFEQFIITDKNPPLDKLITTRPHKRPQKRPRKTTSNPTNKQITYKKNTMPKFSPPNPLKLIPDPRPSKANPQQRSQRKAWEKQHSDAFEWMPWVALALTGVAVAIDIEKDVRRCEERKETKQQELQGSDREYKNSVAWRGGGKDWGRREDWWRDGRGGWGGDRWDRK
jgi:hypothetical protein